MEAKAKDLLDDVSYGEKTINYELQYTRWLLSIIGVWPMISSNVSKVTRLASALLLAYSFFAIGFILIPITTFMMTKVKDLSNRLVFIGPIGFRITNITKLLMMIHRAGIIKECLDSMRNNWLENTAKEDQDVMLKSVNLGRSLTIICAIFMYSGGIFFHIAMPLLKPKKVNAFNVTIRPHAYPGYDVFFDSQSTPAYEIIFAGHFLCAASGYIIVTASCNLAAVFVSHISGQVQVIKLKLARMVEDESTDKAQDVGEHIASVIRSHVKILKFSDRIKEFYREICLVEVILSTIVICWLEYYCMRGVANNSAISIITYCMVLISFSFNIFIYCYIGQILKDQCESVGEIVYMCNWHKIPAKHVLSLAFVISMTKPPLKRYITAGGMIDLTIRSFGDIMKTSVAYLNVLRAVT